jgi:hypothetical protein
MISEWSKKGRIDKYTSFKFSTLARAQEIKQMFTKIRDSLNLMDFMSERVGEYFGTSEQYPS